MRALPSGPLSPVGGAARWMVSLRPNHMRKLRRKLMSERKSMREPLTAARPSPSPHPSAPLRPPSIDERAGVIDELQAWYLARAERDGWVYTSVLRQLINRMYRERDYLAQRKRDGRRTAYDYAVDRDQVALAWAIRAIVRQVPLEEKQQPEPPKP